MSSVSASTSVGTLISGIFKRRASSFKGGRNPDSPPVLRQILHLHPGVVAITDTHGTLEAASERFLQWFPDAAQAMETHGSILHTLSTEDVYNYRNLLQYVVRESKTVSAFELGTTALTTEHTMRVMIAPLLDSKGEVVGLLHQFQRVNAPDGLNADLDHLEKLTNMGQVAAAMAHELNTPLGSIILSADILRDMPIPDSAHAEITKIKMQATHSSQVVRRLLDYARRDDHERADRRVQPIVQKVMSLVEAEARRRDIVFFFEPPRGRDRICCNENEMEQLFFNLFSNSLHAIGNRGRIDVQMSDDGLLNQLSVTVSDTGCGIAAEHLDRVFEPFFTTKSRQEGTGLGLAVSRKIVMDHGGKIEVKSIVGTGTTFNLSFPLAP